jgi:amino acid transporter
VVDLLSVLIAFTLAASRLLMALAREGLLPSAVAQTSRRFHSPVGGLTVITVWALLVMLWADSPATATRSAFPTSCRRS